MPATSTKIPQEVDEYLQLHHIITLSTASFTGMPHANTVAYTSDESTIFFAALEGTTVARNILDNHYVSFTIDDYTTDWRKVRELQGVGQCKVATEEELTRGSALFARKFGSGSSSSIGVVHGLRPIEMHFVDYDYALVAAGAQTGAATGAATGEPEVSSRTFQFEGRDHEPSRAALSTELDRTTFGPGDVIFRPGDQRGQYYVVVEGEVEIRGEGFGADQTVTRVRSGQMFGDEGTMRGQRGVFTAHAVQSTVLLAVNREAMRDLLLP